jgi:putative ABC transport system permease protein
VKLKDIALNNLRRRKGKVLFLVIGLMIGVAAIVALMTTAQILTEDIAHKMDEFGANIVVSPKSEGLSLTYGGLNLGGLAFDLKELTEEDVAKIKTIENSANIRIVSPKVFGVFTQDDHKALAVGVNFDAELAMKKWWKITGKAPSTDDEVLLGYEASDRLGLAPGDSLTVKDKQFTVSGVIRPTGSQDDGLVLMKLSEAQELFDKEGKIGMVEVAALCKNCPITEIVAQISGKIPTAKVTAVQQVVQGRMDTLNSFKRLSLGISALVLLVGSMVVFVTMMAGVNERTREIGIFSAIGFRSSHIMRIILLEAFIVSLMAGLLGYGVGMGAAKALLTVLSEKVAHFTFDPMIAVGSLFLAIFIGLAASVYPARVASGMDPSEALRTL